MNIRKFAAGSLAFALSLSFAGVVHAGAGMSDEEMQQMMAGAQEMQKCMAGIDQSQLEKLSARAEAMDEEVKELCAAGNRDEAQSVAIEYGKEISTSPVMQDMKKCGEMAKGMMPDIEKDLADRHACDGI